VSHPTVEGHLKLLVGADSEDCDGRQLKHHCDEDGDSDIDGEREGGLAAAEHNLSDGDHHGEEEQPYADGIEDLRRYVPAR